MSKRTIAAILIAMIAGAMLTAHDLENGISAIEDTMTKTIESSPANSTPTPGDFPEAYNYGSGKIAD